MFDLNKLVRDNVKALKPYSCARDEYHGGDGIFLDANENPYGALNRYPDPYQKELKASVSMIKGVPEDMIFLGNGSDEIIDLCFRIFCKPGADKALTFTPSYGMYEVSASANDVNIIKIPLDKNFQVNFDDVIPWLSDVTLKLILICSPNNPTGNCIDRHVLEQIIVNFDGIVLVDEAYIDFADKPSLLDRITSFRNLIVMQTFSKAFGLASVRVGMAFTSPDIIHYFNKMKPPYNISTINQKAVLQKLGKINEYKIQVRKIKEERERLTAALYKLPFTKQVFPSDANFLLVKVKDAGFIYNTLVDRGIIVRNRSSVIDNCLRITVGTKTEDNELIKALKTIEI
ncbi:MAG: histidinol-phosphate transaminase [Bacteroidales bacterium]|nr:histidinol-phosphate transaminase [Bacteroidales bacterium]